MKTRLVEPRDRAEWLRMLLALYAGSSERDHVEQVDPYLAGEIAGCPAHVAVFVVERHDGQSLAGFLELSVRNYAEGCTGATPYVESWFVDADVRGQGIGRWLLQAAEDWTRSHGYTELASDADLGNALSISVHLSTGFEEVERLVHFRKKVLARSGD
jgi:aminoglycoside 6'-N-acetyltransferase I